MKRSFAKKPYNTKPYFISFIEEYWPHQEKGTVMGRIEVYRKGAEYSIEEIRFATRKVKEFYVFRENWDFKNVNRKELKEIKKIVRERYLEE